MRRRRFVLLAICLLVLQIPVAACLWDRDTLEQERQRFPSTLELITGQFLRHSEEFYAWRLKDRTEKLKQDADNVELYDDIAVAYDKLGEHDQAIATILQKEELSPGLYETYANLGTFHIHAGNFEEGLKHIQRAIEINPDAHFGREVYQQLLVEYLLSHRDGESLTLPLDSVKRYGSAGFASFVFESRSNAGLDLDDRQQRKQEFSSALKGVLGMMRFGNHDSPVLLEAVGDLLLAGGSSGDAKRLAARAYLKASYETDGETSAAYRSMAESALFEQTITPTNSTNIKIEEIEATFKQELAVADAWFDELKQKELQWIETAADPEAEFAKEYFTEPELDVTTAKPTLDLADQPRIVLIIAAIALLPVLLIAGRKFFAGTA